MAMIPTSTGSFASPNYQNLFDTMVVKPKYQAEVNAAISKILKNKQVYEGIAKTVNPAIPYYLIGICHYLECSCNINAHIHCGDPLTARTTHIPKGRPVADPKAGKGKPYSFEESCIDWLKLKKWDTFKDWSIPQILSRLEGNNGLGYQKRGIYTPYLWSYTNHYTAGKYVADNKFSSTAISKQVGAACIVKYFHSSK